MNNKKYDFKVFLGNDKDSDERIYLTGFNWDCDWYWSGGYLEYRSKNGREWKAHTHFDSVFIEQDYNGKTGIWKNLGEIVNNAQYNTTEWWRIKDLYKQFYTLKEAAETFRHGGHCTSKDRNPKEIDKTMENKINNHIESVIIPEIMKVLKV